MLVQDSKTLILMALLVSSNAPLPFLNRLQQIKREKSLVYQTYCRPDSTRILCNNIRLFCVPAFGKILTFLIPKSLEKKSFDGKLAIFSTYFDKPRLRPVYRPVGFSAPQKCIQEVFLAASIFFQATALLPNDWNRFPV